MPMTPIVPAVIPKSADHLKTTLEQIAFSPEIHVDVVDGRFVPALSWPYEPTGLPREVKEFTDKFTLEVDLMVCDPLPDAVDWVSAGADMVVFHLETVDLDNFKKFSDFTHVSVGVSAHGDTTLESLLSYMEYADYVQLMGIKQIGAQGQPFSESVFDTITAVKKAYPNKPVTVDGSVNQDTIVRLAEAGVDRFIVGSAITLQPDPAAAHRELATLLTGK